MRQRMTMLKRLHLLPVLAAAVIALPSPASSAGSEPTDGSPDAAQKLLLTGVQALQARDLETAEKKFKQAREAGMAQASFYLGLIHIRRDEIDAAKADLAAAADAGYAAAARTLGRIKTTDVGGRPQLDEGEALFRQAARSGQVVAQLHLAEMLMGRSDRQSAQAALKWLIVAHRTLRMKRAFMAGEYADLPEIIPTITEADLDQTKARIEPKLSRIPEKARNSRTEALSGELARVRSLRDKVESELPSKTVRKAREAALSWLRENSRASS